MEMIGKYKCDNADQPYTRVENIRVTIARRDGDKDWAGTKRYLKIQAYRDGTTDQLHPGPDLPIRNQRSEEEILAATEALLKLLVS
jgi:hypothetical protein